jgi:hypothetical protein
MASGGRARARQQIESLMQTITDACALLQHPFADHPDNLKKVRDVLERARANWKPAKAKQNEHPTV